MTETPELGSSISRTPRRWRRRVLYLITALGLGGGAAAYWRTTREPDCKTASRTLSDGLTVDLCRREFSRTGDPLTGTYLADALRRSGNNESAAALANDLLSTDVKADALQILGKIAKDERRPDDAVRLLQEARQLHRERGNHRELARDDQALALIQEGRDQYSEALETLDEAIAEARVGADTFTETYCHITAARVLTDAGYFDAAQQELDRAAQQATTDRELAELWFWRGNLEQEVVRGPLHIARHRQAVAAFERSLEFAQRAQVTSLILLIHLNLVYSLAEIGRVDDADRHLTDAGLLDRVPTYESQRRQLAARVAYNRKSYSHAYDLNEQAYPAIDDPDERIDVCVMQARIALRDDKDHKPDLPTAILWAKRGVENAEKVRREQTLSELRPWVLATRRQPFELLFIAYARADRIEDAIGVFDQWQGRTLLDEMARPSPEPLPGLSSTASRIQSLGRWLPAVSKAPLMSGDARATKETLRMIDLVALAVAEGEIWRLVASHGRFALDNRGRLDAVRDRLDRFIADPTDPALADELGALFLPDGLARKTDDPLYVVLDAPFAGLPFVALRSGGQPLIAARPVLRTPRFPVIGSCAPRAETHSAQVLADAAGDLPDARRESSKVASLFGTTPLVGAAATSAALFAAKSEPLLHVAVHAEIDSGGGVLKLHDRAVSAAEISANKLGPSLVVLSACSTARSADPELAGSLSTAFLAGGSKQVVATLRPVSDAGALELTSHFYEAQGNTDPVGKLAQIQADLARTGNKEWPNFAVFGSEICKPR